MLQNYFKIAWRNLWKERTHAFVNIIGLIIGITVCLLIVAYVLYEQSYDRFNQHHATLYRVAQHQQQDGAWYEVGRTPAKLAAALKAEFPEVKISTRFALWGSALLTYRNQTADEPNRLLAESSLFDLFTFPFVQGDPQQALAAPNSIILTQRLARRYFGKANPIGRIMVVDQKTPMRVTGVIQDVPANSHLQFDYIIPLSYAKTQGANLDEWGANAFYTYVQLNDAAQQATVNKKLISYAQKAFGNQEEQFYLQPLINIHLYSRFDFNTDFGKRGDIRYIQFFTALALLILLLGCLNFTNLATARALTRAKEVGLRKAIGAERQQLIIQFFGESALIVVVAGTLAVGLVQLCLPFLSSFLQKPLALPLTTPAFWLLTGGIIILTILVAGSYPAFVLSSFGSVRALRGQIVGSLQVITIRKGLVIGQFALSITMVIAALLIYQQLRYINTKKLGLQKDNIVYVRLQGNLKKNISVAKEDLLRQPRVQAVSATGLLSVPFKTVGGFGTDGVEVNGKRLNQYVYLADFQTDFEFIETMGLTITQGRSFSSSFGGDTTSLVLNETAVRQLNLNKPVGTQINLYGATGTVVGVVRDFHFANLKALIQPAVLRVVPREASYLLIRIAPQDINQTMAIINTIANKHSQGFPVEAHFLTRDYDQLYQQEQTAGILFAWFTGLAIMVSCLGLFGLAAFTAQQRTKEIGVRKVLGASVASIVALLSKDFLKLVLVAIVLASPIAWWIMYRWLQNFAYKIDIEWWVFALAGALAVGIALLTVSFQSVKAALMNPVKSLRSE